MIRRIAASSFMGASFEHTIPAGSVEIRGPSGAGKSRMLAAVDCALVDTTAAKRAGIVVEIAAGKLGQIPAMDHPRIRRSPSLFAAILVPMQWLEIDHRELADLIATAAGVSDDRSVIDGILTGDGHAPLAETEAHTVAAAEQRTSAARQVATRTRATADALLGATQEAAPTPAEGDPAEAQAALDAATLWRAYRQATSGPAWSAADAMALRVAGETLTRAEADLTDRIQRSEAAARAYTAATEANGRALMEGDAAAKAAKAAKVAGERVAAAPCKGGVLGDVDCAACPALGASVAEAATLAEAEHRVAALRNAYPSIRQAAADAHVASATAEREAAAARVALSTAADARDALERRRRQSAGPTPPPEPTEPEPTAAHASAARATAAAHATYPALRDAHAARVSAAAAKHEAAEQSADEAAAELTRAALVLAAVRAAPAAKVRRSVAALSAHLPPEITIAIGSGRDARDPAVRVLVDGRPFGAHSTGEKIAADAWFRAALRSAAGLGAWPLAIDEVQSCTLPLPDAAPIWYLVTDPDADADALTITVVVRECATHPAFQVETP